MDNNNGPEFKKWSEIERFEGVHVVITEKIHGTNAQIYIYEENGETKVVAGARKNFLSLEHDNFGFATFVSANQRDIVEALGHGRHYGEWTGPGINSDYGLTSKKLFLFNTKLQRKLDAGGTLPPYLGIVPVLYDGPYTEGVVQEAKDKLLKEGSRVTPGFMRPEGVVLFFPQFGVSKKSVFKPEETAWTNRVKAPKGPKIDYTETARPFLQPIRLEKLAMRDETYTKGFPENLPTIVRAYLDDLYKETQGMTAEQVQAVKKTVYIFIKEEFDSNERIRRLRHELL